MKTEIDGDGRRWRQMKMKTTHSWDQRSGSFLIADSTPEWWRWRQTRIETGSLWGGAKWQLLYSWWHPRVTKTELDISPLMPPTDSWPHEGCSSLCSPRSSHGTTPVLSFLDSLSGKQMVLKPWQSLQVVPTGLTEDKLQNFRHYGLYWITSSWFPTVLCSLSRFFSVL